MCSSCRCSVPVFHSLHNVHSLFVKLVGEVTSNDTCTLGCTGMMKAATSVRYVNSITVLASSTSTRLCCLCICDKPVLLWTQFIMVTLKSLNMILDCTNIMIVLYNTILLNPDSHGVGNCSAVLKIEYGFYMCYLLTSNKLLNHLMYFVTQ